MKILKYNFNIITTWILEIKYIFRHFKICFKNQKFCQGGWQVGNELCKSGNIGGLCEACDIYNIRGDGNYFKDSQNQECSIISKLLIDFSIWKNTIQIELRSQEFYNIVLINYLWIFQTRFTFNITFSFQFNAVEQISNPSYFMANSLDCIIKQINIELTYLKILVALILIVIQFFIFIFLQSLITVFRQNQIDKSVFSNSMIYLYLQNNGSIINKLSSLLVIRQISGIQYISGDVSLEYDTESHQNWIKQFIIPSLLSISVLIPLFLFLLLFANRNNLNVIKFRKHFYYLFNEYNENEFYWELVKIIKKTLIIFVLIQYETQILLKAQFLGCILFLYQLFVTKKQPFIFQNLNSLDLKTVQICCF